MSAVHERADAGTPTVLEEILRATRAEVQRRKRETPLEEPAGARIGSAGPYSAATSDRPGAAGRSPAIEGDPGARPFHAALTAPGVGAIAEFKRRSPSAGSLRDPADVRELVRAYERAGAAAVSVLTEGPHFDGSLEDLRAARAACALPLLRKDFIVDPYQLHEARAAGADAVLLIVAALDDCTLRSLHQEAADVGLDALVEVHDRAELRRALDAGARLIGINNRDLRDFSVDVERTYALLGDIPAGVAVVSESGISTPAHLRRLAECGVHGALIGEALMRAADPEAALRGLLQGLPAHPS